MVNQVLSAIVPTLGIRARFPPLAQILCFFSEWGKSGSAGKLAHRGVKTTAKQAELALFLTSAATTANMLPSQGRKENRKSRRCWSWTVLHNNLSTEFKIWPHLPLSLWSAARPASRSARGMASTGRCHLSGGRPPRRCSPTAWPDWSLCTVLSRLPAPDQPAGPRNSWCRPGWRTGQVRELFNEDLWQDPHNFLSFINA